MQARSSSETSKSRRRLLHGHLKSKKTPCTDILKSKKTPRRRGRQGDEGWATGWPMSGSIRLGSRTHHWLPRAGGAGSYPFEAPRDVQLAVSMGLEGRVSRDRLFLTTAVGKQAGAQGGRTRSGRRGGPRGAPHWQGTCPAEAKRFGRECARLL